MLCRFYSYTLDQVVELTIKEFEVLNENMVKIHEMENPDPDKKQKAEPGVIPDIPLGFETFIDRKDKE